FLPRGDDNWKVGIVAYWTLFDSGKAKSKTEQSKAKARELLDRLDDMKNIIRTEVTQAGLNLRSAQRRLNVTEHQVAVSEEDYRITKQRYQEHVGTNLDLLDARLALTDSRREFVDALYDIAIAKANLIYAIGSE
ncbi:MAG TPA: TolC family protein, partial [Synergistaceae bacterium]|nr:TolC family protein [Synergistaceae bacterium]